jgi:hypothetical protein
MDLFLIPIFFSLFLALILILYLVPLDLAFAGSIRGGEPGAARITAIWGVLWMRSTWQGGGTYFEIFLAGRKVMCWEGKAGKEALQAPKKRAGVRFLPILNVIPVLWPKIQRVLVIFRDSVSRRNFDCEVVYGTGDPVMTGMLYGFYCAVVLPILPYGNAVSVRVNPVFDREIFSIRLDMKLRLHRPLRPFITAAALLLRKDSLDALRTLSTGGAR